MSPTMRIIIVAAVAVQVEAGSHTGKGDLAECRKLVEAMTASPPQTAGGESCGPEGRRLSDLTASSSWRRLGGHGNVCESECFAVVNPMIEACDGIGGFQDMADYLKTLPDMCCGEMLKAWETSPPKSSASGEPCVPDNNPLGILDNICDPVCTAKANDVVAMCSTSSDPSAKGMADMFGQMVPACTDKCMMAGIRSSMNECDWGDNGAKVCQLIGTCKDIGCEFSDECSKSAPSGWEDMIGPLLKEFVKCPSLCLATSAGTRTMLSSLMAAFFFAAFALQ